MVCESQYQNGKKISFFYGKYEGAGNSYGGIGASHLN